MTRWSGLNLCFLLGPRQANLVLIAYASSEGSSEPAHPRSLARTFAARSYKQWVKRNLQTESQIPGPSEWLGMRSWNLSWRNARRHKFAWRGSFMRGGGAASFIYGWLVLVTNSNLCGLLSKGHLKIKVGGSEDHCFDWKMLNKRTAFSFLSAAEIRCCLWKLYFDMTIFRSCTGYDDHDRLRG